MIKIKYKNSLILCLLLTFLILATINVSFANENNTTGDNITPEENIDLKEPTSDIFIEENNLNIEYKHDELLSQSNNDNLLVPIKTKLIVSNISKIVSQTKPKLSIKIFTANVQTENGGTVNKGHVRFEITKTWYDKITFSGANVKYGVASLNDDRELYLNPGIYTCTAYYEDFTETYEPCSSNFYLTVKTRTSLTVNNISCKKGEQINIYPILNSQNNIDHLLKKSKVIIKIDSQIYETYGGLSLKINKSGLYKCSAKFVGNSYYLNSSTKTFYINVAEDTKIHYTLDLNNILVGDKFNLYYNVLDSYGNTMNENTVRITALNQNSYYSSDGHVLISAPNKPGQYKYEIYHSGRTDNNFKYPNHLSSREEFYINVYAMSTITLYPLKKNIGEQTNIEIKVKDNLGQNINEGKVKVTICGETYIDYVEDGKAVFNNVKMPSKAGTYHYCVTYSTYTDHYKSSSNILEITCKQASKITVKSITGYEGKKVKLTAIVKDTAGNIINKGTVKFKVKGKTYKAAVKNGKATITIKIPVAKEYKTVTKTYGSKCTVTTYYKSVYNCKATFSGYKQFPSCSSKFKVTSKYKPDSYSYTVAKKKTSTSTSSSKNKKVSETYTFSVPHSYATVTVRIYTGSKYNDYSTGTDWLGNGAIAITETAREIHKVELRVHYYDNGFKTAIYNGGSIILR